MKEATALGRTLLATVIAVLPLFLTSARASGGWCGDLSGSAAPGFHESVADFRAYRDAKRQETIAAGGPMAGDADFLRTALIPFGRENARKLAEHTFNQQTIVEANLPFMMALNEPDRDAVVLVHGLLSTPAMMLEWGQHFYDAGFNVIGVRLAGHGTRAKDLAPVTLQQWRDDLRCGLRLAQGFGNRVYLFGYSLGGALAIDAAFDPSLKRSISGAVAMAPAIRTSSRMKGVCGLGPGFHASFDLEMILRPFMYDSFVAGALCELSRLQKDISERVGPALETARESKDFVELERRLFERERSIQRIQTAVAVEEAEAAAEAKSQEQKLAASRKAKKRKNLMQKYERANASRQAGITKLVHELDAQRSALVGEREDFEALRSRILQESGYEEWAADPVPVFVIRSEYDRVVSAEALRAFSAVFAEVSFVNYLDEGVTHDELPILKRASLGDQLDDLVRMEYFFRKRKQRVDDRDDVFYGRKDALQAAILAFISRNPE